MAKELFHVPIDDSVICRSWNALHALLYVGKMSSPLHTDDEAFALEDAAMEGDLETVKFFIRRGVTVDYDAVDSAIANGHLDVVKYFMEELGVRPDDALHTAMSNGNISVTDYLISLGYYPGSQDIMSTIAEGHLHILKYLQRMGIKIDDRDDPVLPRVLNTYPNIIPTVMRVLANILTITTLPSGIINSPAKEFLLAITGAVRPFGTGRTDIERLINFYY